jgi:regulator of protease activity HflC (stomatin/prohibitin superfamily)
VSGPAGHARPLRAGAALFLALTLSGCGATTSTEVGVRTRLVWFFEKRGAQEVYPPGGVYFFLPVINSWNTLPISQQNLLMTANPNEGDRLGRDDITFKTKDGNNVYIDVNVMWRIDPKRADYLISNVGQSALEIKERLVRPLSRSAIRDVFNEITSEEYYQVTVKNRMAASAKELVAKELAPFGVLVDQLQVQQHRFDKEYQDAINAQKQAEADVQTLVEQQKNMAVQKQSELEGKRSEWNKRLEDALGEAGRIKNEADGYYQTKTNLAKATIAVAQAEAEGLRKEADALGKLGGDAYVKMQVAKQLAQKKILIVPGSNVSTMNVNEMVSYLLGKAPAPPGLESAREPAAPAAGPPVKR